MSPLITRVRSNGVPWAVVIVDSAAQAEELRIKQRLRERAIVVLKRFIQKGADNTVNGGHSSRHSDRV
jgi:hypothetical protein